jgi:ribosomal protein S3
MHPNVLVEFIAGQLKNRVSFRIAMKKTIELTEQSNTKGIQVQIAGRLDQVGNAGVNQKSLGRAGSKCWLGERPVVRKFY